MSGHYSNEVGAWTIEDIEIQYEAPRAIFEEPMLLIRVNRLYKPGISAKELYGATRMQWRVGSRAFKITYACGLLRYYPRVYEVRAWQPMEVINGFQRHGFTGKVATPTIRDKYRHTSVKHVFKQGQQSSITYVGLDTA